MRIYVGRLSKVLNADDSRKRLWSDMTLTVPNHLSSINNGQLSTNVQVLTHAQKRFLAA